jgi:Protein of unknown function (DUF2671)
MRTKQNNNNQSQGDALNTQHSSETSDLVSTQEQQNVNNETADSIFDDVRYICSSTELITKSLQDGHDVAQLPDGCVMVTEIRTINILYGWDRGKNKMVKISQT